MSGFSLGQFRIDFADYLDLFNIRRDTTDQDIASAISAVMTTYWGEACFDHRAAEDHFRAHRDYLKRLRELWFEDELPEEFFDTAPNSELEAVFEMLLAPRVIDDIWMEEEDTND